MVRTLIRYGVDELINHAQAACSGNDREQAQIILDELQHRNARKATTLRSFLMGFLAAPAPMLPPPVAPAPLASPRPAASPPTRALAAPPAPSWWYVGCGKTGKVGEPNPSRVRACTAAWAAASPAFRALVETGKGWYATPLAEWPDCPERDARIARRAEVDARQWAEDTLEWPSVEAWELAAKRAPAIRKLKDGRPRPDDCAAWTKFMREARERAWSYAKGGAA